MKRKLDIKSVVLGAVLGGLIVFSLGAANGGSGSVWEYKTVTFSRDSDEEADSKLNQLTQQRWSVDSFTATFPPAGHLHRVYLLKRTKQ